jgi:erythromycin esterase-like protein
VHNRRRLGSIDVREPRSVSKMTSSSPTADKRALEDFKSWAREHAIPFDPTRPAAFDPARLSALAPMLDGKRFAYLGEPDHFIHEKYAYRTLMLRWLTANGFTHVGEELGVADAARVARFIRSGEPSYLERVATYGYKGAARADRDDAPVGILRDNGTYPTAEFAAEQKRLAQLMRAIGLERESRGEPGIHYFGFDVDPPNGVAYEDALAMLEHAAGDATVSQIVGALNRVTGETLDDEIERLAAAIAIIQSSLQHLESLLGAADAAELWHAIACLRGTLAFRRDIRTAKSYPALNPAMAERERFMQREMNHAVREAGPEAKFVLMSHNMHLCRDIGAVARSDADAGPGGNKEPPLGAYIAARFPGQVFACWMLVGQGRDCHPFVGLPREITIVPGTLNAILAEIGACFILPVDRAEPRARLLASEMEIRWDGITGARLKIASEADAIFFVRDVTPLRIDTSAD